MSEFGKDFSEKIKSSTMKELMRMISDVMREINESTQDFCFQIPRREESIEIVYTFKPEFPVTFIECSFISEKEPEMLYPMKNADPRDFKEDHTGQEWNEYNQCWVWL